MTFLQPALLAALPLVALPVIIHLINQRRFQSVEWAAMMFLRSARSLSRGYTRLRRWLIMALRMAAVAAVILAVSRPLSQGFLAAVGGDRAGTAIVLLDRSPSMVQAAGPGGESKLDTARRQLAAALETLGTKRTVLIDSVSCRPVELASPRALLTAAQAEPSAATADLPRLLQAACEELAGPQGAAGTIWICSDQRANDWKPADGAWEAIRATLAKLQQSVRVTLVGYTEPAPDDLAVRVENPVLQPRGNGWELVLDIAVRRRAAGRPARVPVQIELGRARSTVEVDLTETEALLSRHAIPVDAAGLADAGGPVRGGDPGEARGFGRVSIPADDNPADNEFFFTFGVPMVRRTVVVAEDPQTRRVLQLVAGIAPDKLLRAAGETIEPGAFVETPLDDVALVLWQAPLPEGADAEALARFVDRGGQAIFLPPEKPAEARFRGLGWGTWSEHSPPLRPASWRIEEGLLASTRSGAALPVGDVELRRTCAISGEGTALAVLPDSSPLLVRAGGGRGGVYFLASTPSVRDSDLAAGGVVLYALVQRAIDDGLESVGSARQADAGKDVAGAARDWRQLAGSAAASTEAGFHAGVYAMGDGLVAVNRPAAEDAAEVVADRTVDALFQGLRYSRFEQKSGGSAAIVEEIWRLFLVAVLVALVAEGLLCLPARPLSPAALRAGRVAA